MDAITTTEITCCSCATRFSVDDALLTLRHKDGGDFFCPNGHAMRYGNSLADQLAKAKTELAETQNELRDSKIEITRLKCEVLNLSKPKNIIQRVLGN